MPGLKHGRELSQITFYGNNKWPEYSTKATAWFVRGEVKYFESAQEALEWLDIQH